MRAWLLWFAVAPLLSGCFADAGLEGTGTSCKESTPIPNGFRVTVPAVVGEGPNRVDTTGWCVEALPISEYFDGWRPTRQVGLDHIAWIPADTKATYRLHLAITEPNDRYCAFSLGSEPVEHSGTGIIEVALTYDGVSECA